MMMTTTTMTATTTVHLALQKSAREILLSGISRGGALSEISG